MPAETIAETTYPIEISGWDLDQTFFVERVDLEWSESEKKVRLQHALRKGSLVFVRLMGESKKDIEYPLAYEILNVQYERRGGTYETLLSLMHPHTNAEMETADA
jgi:hypothetical protein